MSEQILKKVNSYPLQGNQLQNTINELCDYYEPINLSRQYYNKKLLSIKKLDEIFQYASKESILEVDCFGLVKCALTVVYYFGMRLKIAKISRSSRNCRLRKSFLKAEDAFQRTLSTLLPEKSLYTIKVIFDFFSSIQLWPYENFVAQILVVVLYCTHGEMFLFNELLTNVHHVVLVDVKSARHRIRILYELLGTEHWVVDSKQLLPFITRLLHLFTYGMSRTDSKMSSYKYLKRGFDVCLRRIFKKVDNHQRLSIIITMLNWVSMVNLDDDGILELASLIEFELELYEVKQYSEYIPAGLMHHIIQYFIGSPNATISLIGCRFLQTLLDRRKNTYWLFHPTLYFTFSQVYLRIGEKTRSDKSFIRHHRAKIHDNIIKAIGYHCHSLGNTKAIFSLIACIVLEVPCSLTAAAVSCLLMEMQSFAINAENVGAISRYWIHTVVISVMSLICWVHKASVLNTYVNHIIARRAKEAPQLNPPLKLTYDLRHVTWNKPTLFFEDWELRYGLWKHFQAPQVLSN